MAEHEEKAAERAKEFLQTLNRRRPSRKHYSFSSHYVRNGSDDAQKAARDVSTLEAGFSPFTASTTNPFTASTTSSGGGAVGGFGEGTALANLGGGDPIYREINEKESVSKWRNALRTAVPQPIRAALTPPSTLAGWKAFLFVHLPVVHWLWLYRPKQLVGDIIAGFTIGVTHIPQGIGFALLAGLPPVYGLYSSFVPVILYSILGSSRHISVGTFPVVALMTGNAIARIIERNQDICPPPVSGNATAMGSGSGAMVAEMLATNGTSMDPCLQTACTSFMIDIAVTLSLLVGILMIGMSILKLGFITLFLSDSLVSGYTAAAAFTILVTQIRFLFGLPGGDVEPGPATTPRRVIKYCELIFTGNINGAAIVTSIICIIILISLDYINGLLRRFVRKVPIPIPAQLVVVILVTGISFGADLNGKFELPVVSDLGGIPPAECFGVTLPKGDLLSDVITDAIIIAIISFVINISQAKLLAKKNGYTVHPDQEFLAYGVMNFGGAFFGSFPTAGALSRTILQDATGGNTQLVGFISSAIVIIVTLFLGALFGPLPSAALAAIVVVALKGLYFQVRDIYKYFKLSWADMCVWIVVFLATLLIGLDIGLGVGVGFSLLVVITRTILPFSPALGAAVAWHFPPEEKFVDDEFDVEDLRVHQVPEVYIFQFNAPLYFANVGVFRSRLHIETGIDPSQSVVVEQGCFQQCFAKLCSCCGKKRKKNYTKVVSKGSTVTVESEASESRYHNFDTLSEDSFDEAQSSDHDTLLRRSSESSESDNGDSFNPHSYHTIVLDCAPISFADSMGLAMLEQVMREYASVDVQVLLAAPTTPLCEALNKNGFFSRYSSERLFPSVARAVRYAKDGIKAPIMEQPEKPDITLATSLERQLLYTSRPSLMEAKPIELEHRGRAATANTQLDEEETAV